MRAACDPTWGRMLFSKEEDPIFADRVLLQRDRNVNLIVLVSLLTLCEQLLVPIPKLCEGDDIQNRND